MKIKARPDDADLLDSNELFQMNGWLAELRDEGRAESRDADGSGAEENSYAEPRDDSHSGSRGGGRTGSRQDSHARSRENGRPRVGDDSRTGSRQDSHARSRENGRPRLRDDSQAGSRQDSQTGSGGGGRAESGNGGHNRPWVVGHAGSGKDGRARLRDDSQAGSRGDSRRAPRDDGHARPEKDGWARPRDDGQAKPSRGHRRPEALAAAPATTLVTRTQDTVRAVIGDELRLPIMWCEMVSCISWFAHPAALGEADIRARAIDAGWRVDAIGVLVCPQCVQTAPDFQSPLPVALWDREESVARSAQMADEPSAEVVASVARELSHDLRYPASDHPDDLGAASAWIAAVPANDVVRSANGGTSEEVRHPADDHQPEDHPRPGRHRKRLAARLTFASH